MNFLEIIKLVLSLFPLIIQVVQAIENAIPAGGNGAVKLDLIKTTLQSAYDASNKSYGQFESIWPVLQGMVNGVVTAFNATGIFKKSA